MEENSQKKSADTSLIHDFTQPENGSFFSGKIIVFLVMIAVLGVGSGYFLSKNAGTGSLSIKGGIGGSSVSKGAVVGSNDLKTFKDMAEGLLKTGGINGEGQFHLVRPGGESQNVYLTSSSVDLSKFIDKKIKVWGQTQKAQTAGWLMDVGRVEAL
ncbi:MAG: hypothetical protein Q7R53_01360 [bacterium]|nr:hypothetical protein [bacterium]